MKNLLFTCFVLLFCETVSAQLARRYDEIYLNLKRTWNWDYSEENSATICDDFLRFIYTDTSSVTGYFCGRTGDPFSESQTFDSFSAYHSVFTHVLGNGRVVIYDGRSCGGYESGNTFVFHRSANGSFSEVLATPGTVTIVQQHRKNLITIQTWRYPCCADFTEILTTFSITVGDNTATVQQLDAIAISSFVPERHVLSYLHTQPRTLSKTAFLLDAPESAHLVADPQPDEQQGGYTPVFAIYQAGTQIDVQGEFHDASGREWYFVTVSVAEPAEHILFKDDISEKTVTRYAGWMVAEAFAN